MLSHSPSNQQAVTHSLWYWLKGTWVDRILLIIILLSTIMAWQWLQQNLLSGTPMVHIYHGKTLLATYPLQADKSIHFQAKGDIGISEVIIDKQGVRISHSACISQRCTLSGHRHRIGDMLACVPNRILVRIQGQSKQTLDAISE